MPFGFPSGTGLMIQIIQRLSDSNTNSPFLCNLIQLGHSKKHINNFCEALRHSGLKSVDAFLEHRPEFIPVGKQAIAQCLIPCERTDSLYPQVGAAPFGDWYQLLFERMTDGLKSIDEFENNKVSVVTFNYDRSLEHYLCTSLRSLFGVDRARALSQLERLELIHVYGLLGEYPTRRDYEPTLRGDEIFEAAEAMKIIHEGEANTDSLKIARQWIQTAERILFLGFGYHPLNLRRLGFDDSGRSPNPGVDVWGTVRGLEEQEIRAAAGFLRGCKQRIMGIRPDRERMKEDITTLLRRRVRL